MTASMRVAYGRLLDTGADTLPWRTPTLSGPGDPTFDVSPGRCAMKRSKKEFLRALRHAGLFRIADELEPVLPEVVDFDRDHELLERYGLERDVLMSRLGGSP